MCGERDPVTREVVSTCPIMTRAEWQAVHLGCGRVSEALRPWFLAEDAREEELFKQVPKAKRQQVVDAFRAAQKRREAARPRWKPCYSNILWIEPVENRLDVPSDIAAAEKTLVKTAVATGCRCASEGMVTDCERCEGM